MDILSISKEKGKAVIQFNSPEVVELCNALYEAEKVSDRCCNTFYELLYGLMITMDLSQYGHIDSFRLDRMVECRDRIKGDKDAEQKR